MAANKMTYVRLGNSGLKVSKVILGCMSYGSPQWQDWVLPEEEAIKHIKFAWDRGITTFDTANAYSNGQSEVVLGNAIKKLNLPRGEIVVITKVHNAVPSDPSVNLIALGKKPQEVGIINQCGLNRKHIFDSVQASLKRLQLDHIDLFFCHRWDYTTPIEETMQALHDVVKAGWVRYIGMSSCWAWQFHQAQNYAITHNLTPFIAMQNHYNLLYREEEREMFPTLKLFGVGSTPWSPLARGFLTRPLNHESVRGNVDWLIGRYKNESSAQIVSRVEEIAKKKGVSMAQVGMAWILSKPHVTAPVIGSTKLSNLEDVLGGLEVTLTDEEIKYLEEPYKPMQIIGHL
ncbi:aryl-alcohol dehydrogenase [Trametes punicea]|nr:aryl-alcohol dehydrogenase [Trametes punicea]